MSLSCLLKFQGSKHEEQSIEDTPTAEQPSKGVPVAAQPSKDVHVVEEQNSPPGR